MTSRPAYVYRCFDAEGRLIYVGCALDVEKRIGAQHRLSAWWYPQLARYTSERYDDPAEATRREWEVIATESPRWNIQGKPRNTPAEVRDLITALERHENAHLWHNRQRLERVRGELERKQAEALRWLEAAS